MKQLEAVYLANVILYIPSIESVVKLIQVNKKCQESTKMIRYYSCRKLFENDDFFNSRVITQNLFDLFPNIETIEVNEEDIKNNEELIRKVNQIVLACHDFDELNLTQEDKDKVTELVIIRYSLKGIQLQDFQNVRKVKIKYSAEYDLKVFLGNKNIKLNQFLIKGYDNEQLNYLKDFKNIEIIKIIIENQITKERYFELKPFANVYLQQPINGIEMNNTFGSLGNFVLRNEYDINKLYDLCLFTKCNIETECDLRNCELLEEIDNSNTENHFLIQIKGLKHLKRLERIQKVDCIPSSVTYLSFTPSFNYKELLEKDMNCFLNIKEIKFGVQWNEIADDSKIFMNFKNCTKIDFSNGSSSYPSFEFPINVIELNVGNYVNSDQLKEIKKLTKLKKLSISPNSAKDTEKFQKMFWNLKELEWVSTYLYKGLKLPSTVSYLELIIGNSYDLAQFTNLKEIKIFHFNTQNKPIKLPTKINKLYIYGNVKVINSNEIEIDQIILDNTPSQLCQWNSKNIFVKRKYQDSI